MTSKTLYIFQSSLSTGRSLDLIGINENNVMVRIKHENVDLIANDIYELKGQGYDIIYDQQPSGFVSKIDDKTKERLFQLLDDKEKVN